MSKKITAPVYDMFLTLYHISWGTYITVNENTVTLLHELENHLSKIKHSGDEKYWSFWIKVPKGDIPDFGENGLLHEDGEYRSYDDFVSSWKSCYSREYYWYKIEFAASNGYYVLLINGSCVISISPEKKPQSWGEDFSELLEALIEEVNGVISNLKDGSYNTWLDKELPYRYRYGTIMRKELWALGDDYRDWELKDLQELEISRFLEYISNTELIDGRPADRIKNMTAQNYFDYCALCYRAAKFEDADKLSAKQLYNRYADRRDGHLREIDENSAEIFSEWYYNPDRPGDLAESSHRWEISCGHTHSMIHLYVMRDEQGYYLLLSGGVYCRTNEIVRMYNALRLNNVPVVLYRFQDIADKVSGKGKVGLCPCYDMAYHYWYGGFYEDKIVSFLSLDESNFPDEIEEKIEGLTEWKPLDILELVD